ncbi:MAG TPA: patatin-like phospholipase family protein [Vicinamibacterales bacterium]|nr:patatin-like phospholipase family protein [Vicinamibacterales bacterium]
MQDPDTPFGEPPTLRSWLATLQHWLSRTYATRFPLLLGALLLLFVPLSLWGLPGMLRNALVLSANGLTAVSWFTTVAAFTVMATRRVVLLYAPVRFETTWQPGAPRLRVAELVSHLLVALPLIATCAVLSVTEGGVTRTAAIFGVMLGIAGGSIIVWVAWLGQAFITNRETDLPDMVAPRDPATVLAHRSTAIPPLERQFPRLLAWLRPYLGPGYFTARGDLLPGHVFAMTFLGVFAVVYAWGYVRWQPGTERGAAIPALVFVLVVGILWTWFLTGVSFFLDRFRLPTLLPIVACSLVVWTVSRSDHYFDLVAANADVNLLEAPGVLAAKRTHPLLTVVAIDGGGIQASGWAARVLTGVQAQWPDFARSTRLISAVSGGSVATMYFVNELRPERAPTEEELAYVRTMSTRASLNETAWGLAYPDLWRALIPIRSRFEKDRGWAMQKAWERGWTAPVPTLSDWVRGVYEGWRPAIGLNAVGVEDGQRFSFATFAPPYEWGIWTPDGRYPGRDVSVSTAARLSATFPYVTPIARARPESPSTYAGHFADGGYYDNTGMGLAMRWLDRAISDNLESFRHQVVAFVRIRSSPATTTTAFKDRGWQYQVAGPIQTLMAVRVASQRERAETELDFLQRLWCREGVEVRAFEFAFERDHPPLSWQLSPRQLADIEREWHDPTKDGHSDRNQAALKELLETASAPDRSRC